MNTTPDPAEATSSGYGSPEPGESLSLRQVSAASGFSRTVVRACISDGLVDPDRMGLSTVVTVRALGSIRGTLFPSEAQPANSTRTVRDRERQVAALVDELAAAGNTSASLLVFADRVVALGSATDVIAQTVSAHETASMCILLPVGYWLAEARSSFGPSTKGASTSSGGESLVA